jgi:predicted acetyltransferase
MTADRGLRLRPLRPRDEAAFREGHRAMAASDGFSFGLGLEPGMSWSAYLKKLDDERAGIGLAADRVPATFLVADVGGEIVGRTSIRHALTDYLRQKGGHIGYGVVPGHRRRGYATEILRQSLVVARSIGIGPVLVTCDDDNLGSIAVIEACGGQLDSLVEDGPGRPGIRRYWIG